MSATMLARDAFAPQRPPGMRSGLALALLAHVLLVLALAWSVNWKTSEPDGVVAELWSALPQIAAPRAAPPEPPPPRVEPRPTPPVPRPEPQPAPREDAQIAIERAEAARKAEALRKAEAAAKREEARRAEAERERERERERQRLAEEQADKKKLAEKARQDEARQSAIREANLRRMMNQAGASDDPGATGTAARTSGPSAGYAGRIRAQVKRHITFDPSTIRGNPLATVDVRLAPDGTIVSRKLVKSSGSPAWDEAVLRAIDKTEVLPRDTDGRVPPVVEIDFKPIE
ncbi:MAG: cell envelope integrity protein TolA [Caldimonas sp.]